MGNACSNRAQNIWACLVFSMCSFGNIWINIFCCIGISICQCSPKLGFWHLCQRTRKPTESQQFGVIDNNANLKQQQKITEEDSLFRTLETSATEALAKGTTLPAFRDTALPAPMKIAGHTISWEPLAVAIAASLTKQSLEKPDTNIDTNDTAPYLWVDSGISPARIRQGKLGTCWFLAAVAGLAEKKGFIESQLFDNAKQLRQNVPLPPGATSLILYGPDGQPKLLILDHYFPMSGAKLIFAQSTDTHELWIPLLEKAFAKLRGGYENIQGGVPSTALHALTGAATERLEHTEIDYPMDLWKDLTSAKTDGDIIVAGTYETPNPLSGFAVLCAPCTRCCSPMDILACLTCPRPLRRCTSQCCRRHCWGCYAFFTLWWKATKAFFGSILAFFFCPCIACGICERLSIYATKGLVPSHAYSLVSVHDVPMCCGLCRKRLIKLRNPWGEQEWNGPWSDNSCLWCCIKTKEKDTIGYTRRNDGVFFMAINDYARHFANTSICHSRIGWMNVTVPTVIRGPCAYWNITVSTNAPATHSWSPLMNNSSSGSQALPESNGSSSGGSNPFQAGTNGVAKSTPTATNASYDPEANMPIISANPLNMSGLATSAVTRGVRCFVSILHADGSSNGGILDNSQGLRVCVIADETRKTIGSSRPPSNLSSYSTSSTVGTGEIVLEAGKTYTVFAQWLNRDKLMLSPNGRSITLLLTVSDPLCLSVNIPTAAPLPRYAWSPLVSPFGTCHKPDCRGALPAEFDFYQGYRYHSECRPGAP